MIRTTYKAIPGGKPALVDAANKLIDQLGVVLDQMDEAGDLSGFEGLYQCLNNPAMIEGKSSAASPAGGGRAPGLLPKASSDYSRGNMTAKAANQEKARQAALDKVATGGRSAAFLADMFGRKGGQ